MGGLEGGDVSLGRSGPTNLFKLGEGHETTCIAGYLAAIYCAGWSFPFPTPKQQKLWRISSLAVTTISIITFPFCAIFIFIFRRRFDVFKAQYCGMMTISRVNSLFSVS